MPGCVPPASFGRRHAATGNTDADAAVPVVDPRGDATAGERLSAALRGVGFCYVRLPSATSAAADGALRFADVLLASGWHAHLPPDAATVAAPPAHRDMLHLTEPFMVRLRALCGGGGGAPACRKKNAAVRTQLEPLWRASRGLKRRIDELVAVVARCVRTGGGAAEPPAGSDNEYVRVMRYTAAAHGATHHHADAQGPSSRCDERLRRHVDPGMWTLLLYPPPSAQRCAAPLEVQLPSGGWLAARPPAGCGVLLPGRMLEQWTAGAVRGAVHRVRWSSSQETPARMAAAVFSYSLLPASPPALAWPAAGVDGCGERQSGAMGARPPAAEPPPAPPSLPAVSLSAADVAAHWALLSAVADGARDPKDRAYW